MCDAVRAAQALPSVRLACPLQAALQQLWRDHATHMDETGRSFAQTCHDSHSQAVRVGGTAARGRAEQRARLWHTHVLSGAP